MRVSKLVTTYTENDFDIRKLVIHCVDHTFLVHEETFPNHKKMSHFILLKFYHQANNDTTNDFICTAVYPIFNINFLTYNIFNIFSHENFQHFNLCKNFYNFLLFY